MEEFECLLYLQVWQFVLSLVKFEHHLIQLGRFKHNVR